MLDAALQYANTGWSLIPLHHIERGKCNCNRHKCRTPGKHPRTSHGLKDATTDEQVIRRWWKQWPNANIGIITGRVSGFFALDIDPDKGGNDSLTELIDTYSPLPETLNQITGGNGKHYLFSYPDTSIKNRISTIGIGLDVKGDGGYIVVPPSNHISGGIYQWGSDIEDTPLALAPDWLLYLIDNPPLAMPIVHDGVISQGNILEGNRNEFLVSLGGKLRREGKSKHEIMIRLLEENRLYCKPPLNDEEVQQIAASLGRYRKGPPPKAIKYKYLDWLRSPESPVDAISRHILMDLTCWMNKDGRECFPNIEDIAVTTGLSASTIKRHLTESDKRGWIGRYKYKPGQKWPSYGYFVPPNLIKT